MAEVLLQNNISVIVDNGGLITFMVKTGDVCYTHVHPVDTSALVCFLVRYGYNFCPATEKGGYHE